MRFDLGLLNKFLGDNFGIAGLATGNAIIYSPWESNAGLMMRLVSDSTEVAGRRMGTFRIAGSLGNGKMHVIARNDIDGKRTMNITGDYLLKIIGSTQPLISTDLTPATSPLSWNPCSARWEAPSAEG